MSRSFDRYYKWMRIPPRAQAPHHYRLLGLAVFEGDTDFIESAADQRIAHVGSFQKALCDRSGTLPATRDGRPLNRITFHPTSGGKDGKVLAWNLSTRTLQGELHSFPATATSGAVDFSPKDGLLAVAAGCFSSRSPASA